MNRYEDLQENDKKQLLKFPAYISLLSQLHEGRLDDKEKKTVIKLTHIKTFSSDSLIVGFYRDAEKDFEKNMRSWMNCNCVFISATNKENLEELRNTMILMVQDMYHKRYPYKTSFYN